MPHFGFLKKKKKMSTSFRYGDVSPACYPNVDGKRKRRGPTQSADHGRKKKKESKKKEAVIPPSTPVGAIEQLVPLDTIQQLVPIGLDAFVKDHVEVEESDPLMVLQRHQGIVKEEVLQEGVSCPQPTQDQETQIALQELIPELTELPPATYEDLVSPHHICRLEHRVSRNGWHYAKCPMFPCLLFCAEEKAGPYMRDVHDQVHSDVLKMWKQLLCFCCQPPVLQQSRSEKNPDRMFLTCSKKKCKFFQWGDQPLSGKYRDWLDKEARTPVYLPTSTRDAEGYPLQGVDVPGHPPLPRFERGVEPSLKEALVVGGLERRLEESLKTKVPRPVTEYKRLLIKVIQRLKKKDTVV